MNETQKLAKLLNESGRVGTSVGNAIRNCGLVTMPLHPDRREGARYLWWKHPMVEVAEVNILQLKKMLYNGMFLLSPNVGQLGVQLLWEYFDLSRTHETAREAAEFGHDPNIYPWMLPEYVSAKAKQSGNLHERMKLVLQKKEALREKLESLGRRPPEVWSLAEDLFNAILDVETQVSQYPVLQLPAEGRAKTKAGRTSG